jgi:anti-sigma B factor antagonist
MTTSPARMHREIDEDGGLRIQLIGDIDMNFTVANHAELQEVVEHPPSRLELDTAELTFIDSTGLRAFATLVTCVRAAGGDVRTTNSSEAFRRIVEVTDLVDRFGLATPDVSTTAQP